MSSEKQIEFTYFDTSSGRNQLASIRQKDFDDQLEKLKKAVERVLARMQKLGKLELSEITAKAELSGGLPVFKATGSIEMKWTLPKNHKK